MGLLLGIWVPPVKFMSANIAQICPYDFFFPPHYAGPPQTAEKFLPLLRKLGTEPS